MHLNKQLFITIQSVVLNTLFNTDNVNDNNFTINDYNISNLIM